MNKILIFFLKGLLIFFFISFNSYQTNAEETDSILNQIEALQQDIKTLEKAVYSQSTTTSSGTGDLSVNSSDVLTKHLLKLSDL